MGTYYKNALNYVGDITEGDIIEIGVDRGEGSTAFFIDLAKQKNVNFVGVDAHPQQIENAVKRVCVNGALPDHVQLVHAKGEEYLKSENAHNRQFSIAYLDNFDWNYWMQRPEESFVPGQRQMYRDVMHVEMNNMNSQMVHLVQAMNLYKLLTPKAVVIFDDTWYEPKEGIFIGKCSAALPYFLAVGFQLLHYSGYRNAPGGSGAIVKRG